MPRPSLLSMLLAAPLLAAGCGDKPSDDSGADDSGQDTGPTYEAGCITVDGGGGYAWLTDALTVAEEGSTIALCEGEIDEGVTISKSVVLVGPGPDSLRWVAPVNEPAILVEGAAVVDISGFSVTSTRDGLRVEGSSEVRVHGVRFDEVTVAGVSVTDSEDVLIEDCEFIAPGGGGVIARGGSVEVRGSTFAAPLGFAVRATEGADVLVSNSDIADVTYTAAGEDGVSDGFALWATEGASLSTEGNTLTNNFVNVLTDSADLNLSGDLITGGLYGVYAAGGVQSLSGVSVVDSLLVGIRAISADDITFTDVSVTADPLVVDAEEYGWDSFTGGGVTIATDSTFTATGLTIEGYNNNGLLILGFSDVPTAVIQGLRIHDVGRRALTQFNGTLDITDGEITDMRLVVDPSELDGNYNSQTPGLTVGLWTVNTTWTGGGIYRSPDMGLINFSGALTLSGFTLDGNTNYGIWNYQGSLYATGSTFTNSSGNGGIVNRLGDLTLEGNAFTNNLEPSVYEYTDTSTGSVSRTEYSTQSQDVICYEHSTCDLIGNTFTDGSRGISISTGGAAILQDNTFERYHSYPISVSSNTDGAVEVLDSRFVDIGAYPIRCSSAEVELDGVEIEGVIGASTTYTSTVDGELNYSFEYTTTGPAIYGYACSMLLNNVRVADAAYHAVLLSETSAELYDVEVSGGSSSGSASSGTVRVTHSSTTPALLISGLSIQDTLAGHGLQVTSSSSLDAGTLIIDGVEVSGVPASGLSLESVSGASLTNILASGNGAHGLTSSSSALDVEGAILTQNQGFGAWLGGAGAVSFIDSEATDNASGGVHLSGGAATVTGNLITGNDGFGLTCDAVTLEACASNDLSDNTDGEHDGCDDACGL